MLKGAVRVNRDPTLFLQAKSLIFYLFVVNVLALVVAEIFTLSGLFVVNVDTRLLLLLLLVECFALSVLHTVHLPK